MQEVFLKIIEIAPEPNGVWEAELWSGYPGDPQTTLLAGGSLNTPRLRYTQAQLEAPMTVQGQQIDLSRTAVMEMIGGIVDPAPPGMVDALGLRLFEFLDATGVAAAWANKRNASDGLRTYLSLALSLSQLPFELLAQRTARQIDPMFLDRRNPVVRVHTSFPTQLSWEDSAVRVLLVSGQDVLDLTSKAKASDELRRIRSIFHYSGVSALVHLCEAPATEDDLKRCIEEFNPHIFHFIGHGTALKGSDFELIFRPPGGLWRWSATAMYQYFRQQRWKPRLVVLNACHAAGVAAESASVAESLLDAGIPAVVGAQAELGIDNAKTFAEAFYRRLSALGRSDVGIPLDIALVDAREEIWRTGKSERHWALPVLSVSAPVDQILRFKRAHTQVMSCEEVREVFVRAGRFVNRAADRWKLISTFQPAADASAAAPGLILMGDKRLGKSWLIKRAARDFLDSGFILTHANLNGKTERSSLQVLSDWHGDPNHPSYLRRSIAGPHFADFERELAQARQAAPQDGLRAAFSAFKRGLQTHRRNRPVLLVLDQISAAADSVSVAPQDFRQGLLDQFLMPVNTGDPDVAGLFVLLIVPVRPGPQILPFDTNTSATDVEPQTLQRLITVNRIPEYVTYGLADLDRFRVLQVPGLPEAEAQNLFDEFSDFRTNADIEAIRLAFVAMRAGSWKGPNEETDLFYMLDAMLAKAMSNPVTPL